MKNKIYYNSLVFILIWFLLPTHNVFSQNNSGMLMFQIEGKQFEKINYDKNGFKTNSQVLNVGNIKKDTKGYSLKIDTKIFNGSGTLKSEKSFNYRCDKSQNGAVFMGVFPFLNSKSGSINIAVLSDSFLYPNSFESYDKVNDFSLLVNYKTGFLGVNTKTFLNITNRKITKLINGKYELTGRIEIKTFIGSLNISTLNYSSNEIIDISNGIIFQKYTENDESYFTIELKN